MTRCLMAPVMCSSITNSNYDDADEGGGGGGGDDDDNLSTSEYNGSSTLTPSTAHTYGPDSNATTISSQTSLNNYGTYGAYGDFHRQSTAISCLNNNNSSSRSSSSSSNHVHHDTLRQQSHQHLNDGTTLETTCRKSTNYYGVNDLKEASWRRQANASGALTSDFYGGDARLSSHHYNQRYHQIKSSNFANSETYGSQTSINNCDLHPQAHIRQSERTSINNHHHHHHHQRIRDTCPITTPIRQGHCGDSLDDVSGIFDQMSIQSELTPSTTRHTNYDHKFHESLSVKESFKPSHVISSSANQPTTTLPNRSRHSLYLTRTYSMIGKSKRGQTDADRSMTLNRYDRKFITQNIASVLSKPRAPPVVPSYTEPSYTEPSYQLQRTSSSHMQRETNEYDRFISQSLNNYDANTSYDEYIDAQDASFASCNSQPLTSDFRLSDIESKKKNGGTLSSFGSKLNIGTKGKAMQNQIANLTKKFFSSIPRRKSFINKKVSMFDTPHSSIFLDKKSSINDMLSCNHQAVENQELYNVERDTSQYRAPQSHRVAEMIGEKPQGKSHGHSFESIKLGDLDLRESRTNYDETDIAGPIDLSISKCSSSAHDNSIKTHATNFLTRRMTIPPPPPPFRTYANSEQRTTQTNLDTNMDITLPPPPSDLRSINSIDYNEELKTIESYRYECPRPVSLLDSDMNGEFGEEQDSWRMTSLPLFYERKLTTVFEEQPRENQKKIPTSSSSGRFQDSLAASSLTNEVGADTTCKRASNPHQTFFLHESSNGHKNVLYNGSAISSNSDAEEKDINLLSDTTLDADTTLVSETLSLTGCGEENRELLRRISELELKLQVKEKSFTDLQLDQLSTAYLIDQLRTTIERLEQEKSHLIATLKSYQQLETNQC